MKSNRRSFIKTGALLGGGLALSIGFPTALWGEEKTESDILFEPNLLMQLGKDNIVHFKYTRHEMGQGSFTGLSMIFADELGADWEKFKSTQADYDVKYGDRIYGNTGGSFTIRSMWQPLRELAATARMMLIQAAANEWKVNPTECKAENSYIIHSSSNRQLSFGDLAEKAGQITPPKTLVYKDPKDYKIIGQSKKNLNLNQIIEGTLPYSFNFKLPGMAYAAIARSPYYLGQIKTVDDSEARKVKGFIKTISIKKEEVPDIHGFSTMREGVAVLAENTWAAFEAKKKLKIEWEGPLNQANSTHLPKEIALAKEKKADHLVYNCGDIDAQFDKAATTFSRSYLNPYKVHALMETPSATADYQQDSCEIWSSVQHPKRILTRTGKVVGLEVEQFKLHNFPCGGSFGRRFYDDFITETVFLSKKAAQPIKLVWSREDEIQTSGYHGYQEETHTVALDEANNILGWKQRTSRAARGDELNWGSPIHVYYNKHRFYDLIGIQAQLPVMAWRSVSAHQNALGLECFIDELAHEIKKDPLQLRLDFMNNYESPNKFAEAYYERIDKYVVETLMPRAKRVYEKIQSLPAWTEPLALGHGRGVAGESFGATYAGQVAEVSVNNGKLIIHKITCVVDCGRVINPHQATGQIEGGIIWGLSALKQNITVENGSVRQSNFHDYPVLRMDQMPEIEVIFIESEEAPVGVGEPGVPPVAPAVLNAIFAATGKRIRELPIREVDLI